MMQYIIGYWIHWRIQCLVWFNISDTIHYRILNTLKDTMHCMIIYMIQYFIGYWIHKRIQYILWFLFICFACLFVCLSNKRVTDEPIGPKFCVGPCVTPGKVYRWSNFKKFVSNKIQSWKFCKSTKYFLQNLRIFLLFCFTM